MHVIGYSVWGADWFPTLDAERRCGGSRPHAVGRWTGVLLCVRHAHFMYLQEVKTGTLVDMDPPPNREDHAPLREKRWR